MRWRSWRWLVVAAMTVAIAGCGDDDDDDAAPTSSAAPAPATTAPATTAAEATTDVASQPAATAGSAPEPTAPESEEVRVDLSAGRNIFELAGCGGCHTLADAGAKGTVGPNLDDLQPDADAVAAKVTAGGGGMPSFAGQLTEADIRNVAGYVAEVAGQD